MIDSVECIVIGAGVIGLAVAREMAQQGIETVVIESQTRIGSGISSRNSEVIHAGIYYPTDSLKAELCVKGNKMLYNYCEQRNISYNRCGKLIVATSIEQLHKLKEIQQKANSNKVYDLSLLTAHQALALEPQLSCLGALFSPSTGIVDSHSLMLSFQGDLESAGGMVALGSPLISASIQDTGILLKVGGEQPSEVKAKYVINCAGLYAQAVAKQFLGLSTNTIPKIHYAKGNYFALTGKSPFGHLIYPVPESAGLGVHATLDLGGAVRFGPDVEWTDNIDYAMDESRVAGFYTEIKKYWPEIQEGALVPSYAGIRPKLQSQGEPAKDFIIQSKTEHNIAGLVNLYGIESPGLTASMAIAEVVASLLLCKVKSS